MHMINNFEWSTLTKSYSINLYLQINILRKYIDEDNIIKWKLKQKCVREGASNPKPGRDEVALIYAYTNQMEREFYQSAELNNIQTIISSATNKYINESIGRYGSNWKQFRFVAWGYTWQFWFDGQVIQLYQNRDEWGAKECVTV